MASERTIPTVQACGELCTTYDRLMHLLRRRRIPQALRIIDAYKLRPEVAHAQ
jgi:hypothetical protein